MSEPGPGRLEAFSDGVIAIIITIMVLELHVPHSPEPAALLEQWPVYASYALSFLYVGIYWINHHAMFRAVTRVDDAVLWCNLLMLFFLSLIPFATSYANSNHMAAFPTAVYGCAMLLPALAYMALLRAVARVNDVTGRHAVIGKAAVAKGIVSIVIYAVGVPAAFLHPALTFLAVLVVALMWAMPERWTRRVGG